MTVVAKRLEDGEGRRFDHGRSHVVDMPSGPVALAEFEPGWRWSEHIGRAVGKEMCPATHAGYIMTGQFGVRMKDGTEYLLRAGDTFSIPAEHDGWVVGEEPVVLIEWGAAEVYRR